MIDERDRDRFYRNILSETLPRLVPVSRHKAGIVGEKFEKATSEADIAARIERNVTAWLAQHCK